MIKSKELCLRILSAESEQEVSDIINKDPALSDPANWYPIDGRNTNFNVVTNQASTGSKALTELCTNMVDALLLKHAYLANIAPTGPKAPQSVTEAVRDLVGLPGARSGILAEVDDEKYLRQFAQKNLVIGVSGRPHRGASRCFTFTDNGEGQNPSDFEDTFLSLSKGNKSNIPFVQGKYNMGSSGVLTYCGNCWYKLIASRRYDARGEWGWTLVRRRPGGGTPIAEYFKPNDCIPSFAAAKLCPMYFQSGPQKGMSDEAVSIDTGTVVKLYDYQMESASDFRFVREALNKNLVSTVLPFRLMDYTVKSQRSGRRAQGVDERPLYGMEFILLHKYGQEMKQTDDDELPDEPGHEYPIGIIEDPDLGHISVRAIVLKELPSWLRPNRNRARVFHTVNGQVQFTENRGYLTRCKLPGLKDRIVVIIDASNLSEAGHNDVWKGDREKIRATGMGLRYQKHITDVITSSTFLKNLQREIAREETDQIVKQSRVDLFQNLVNNDPSIAQLLPGGDLVKTPDVLDPVDPEPEWEGKYRPTFLRLVGKQVRRNGAEIAVNGTRTVTFKTDAANDYLSRLNDRGKMLIIPGLGSKVSYAHTLRNGELKIKFQALRDRVEPGDELNFHVALTDDLMLEPVVAELKLRIVKTVKTNPPPPPPKQEQRTLPSSKWLTRDGRYIGDEVTERWPQDFTEYDGGRVVHLEEDTHVYHINYDNAHFRRVLNSMRDAVDKKVVTEQYRMAMLVLMLGINDAYARMPASETKTALEENIDDIRRLAAQGAATVIMSITKTLPSIVNPTAVSDTND